jgi:hypothetical protein
VADPSVETALALARAFHDTYEELAPVFGYETRRESAVPWDDVPLANRQLMIAVCTVIVRDFPALASFHDSSPNRLTEVGDGGCPACKGWHGHYLGCRYGFAAARPKDER